jgi:hypothetical protein
MAGRSAVLAGAAALVLASCTGGGGATAADYPLHEDVRTTVFWIGEPASADNDEIANAQSYWDADWQAHFGGVDDPDHRTADGKWPAGFRPEENPYYFALPYGELDDSDAIKPDVTTVPWYDGQRIDRDHSILKNRWIEVRRGGTTVYAQWQDVGPFDEDDPDYVFGTAAPHEQRAGLDLSPAAADGLGLDGRAEVSWRFVRARDVPDGPWTEIQTTRGGIPETD